MFIFAVLLLSFCFINLFPICVFVFAAAVVVIGMDITAVIVAAVISSCFPFHSFVPLFFSVVAAIFCCGYFCCIIALFLFY